MACGGSVKAEMTNTANENSCGCLAGRIEEISGRGCRLRNVKAVAYKWLVKAAA
jgi:hypothetical protein